MGSDRGPRACASTPWRCISFGVGVGQRCVVCAAAAPLGGMLVARTPLLLSQRSRRGRDDETLTPYCLCLAAACTIVLSAETVSAHVRLTSSSTVLWVSCESHHVALPSLGSEKILKIKVRP